MRWTKTLSRNSRRKLADEIWVQREFGLNHSRLEYSAARRLEHISREIDLVGVLKQRVARLKRPLRFFDSGAALIGVSADLKKLFGDKVEITALTLVHPNISTKSKRRVVRNAKHPERFYPIPTDDPKYAELSAKFQKEHRKAIDAARKDVKLIDHLKVGLIENQSTRTKQDVIFDYSGPLQHSLFAGRVADQYYKMLPRGGIVITTTKCIPVLKGKRFKLIYSKASCAVFERV